MATWLAARYPNVTVGHLVQCHAFRSPSLVAKVAATLQEISGGRFVLGYGIGWNETEHTSYGYDFPSFKTRAQRLEEAVQVVRALWNDSPATFLGDHYQVVDAYCEPLPSPHPPILIGGVGEKYTLPLVARRADWWNIGIPTVEVATHKLEVLREHCETEGRDFSTLRKTFSASAFVGETDEAATAKLEDYKGPVPPLLVGSPETIRTQIEPYGDLGFDLCIVTFPQFDDVEGIRLFVDEVIPRFE